MRRHEVIRGGKAWAGPVLFAVAALPDIVNQVTAGRRRVSQITMSPERLSTVDGWIQVYFWNDDDPNSPNYGLAGLGSFNGVSGNVLVAFKAKPIFYGNSIQLCPANNIPAALMYHEVGHAFGLCHIGGYWPPGILAGC